MEPANHRLVAPCLLLAFCVSVKQLVGIHAASLATCLRLWEAIPDEYKHCHTFSDFWTAYQHVFPAETHQCVGKETGETAHMERWSKTLRQRMSRYVRQTLSFSRIRYRSSDVHQVVYCSV